MQNTEREQAETVNNRFCSSECEEAQSDASDACLTDSTTMPQEVNAEGEMQNAEINSPPDESRPDGKAHLTSSVPRAARLPKGALTKSQMAEMREIFGGIDDAEIHRLYKRVTQ